MSTTASRFAWCVTASIAVAVAALIYLGYRGTMAEVEECEALGGNYYAKRYNVDSCVGPDGRLIRTY